MRKMMFAFVLLFTLAVGGTSLNVKAASPLNRATWLWNTQMIAADPLGTLAFLEEKQVNKVYLQIDRTISMNVYRSFIEKASANGIQILALDGAPDWVAPKGSTSLNQLMNWLGTYQSGSTAAQKFSGVHLDVEPYLYSGWTSNQADTIKAYQSLFEKAKDDTASLKLSLEADIPFWFDGTTYKNTYGKGTLADWIIQNTNGVTVMAYRDSAPAIIDLVKNEMALSEKDGKPLTVGVETEQSSEGDHISFYEEGEAYMNQELTAVTDYYAASSGFGGIAIHHVGSWMTMKP